MDTSNSASTGQKKRRNIRAWLKNAFATQSEAFALTSEDHELMDRVAKWVVDKRLTAPAEMTLESFRPLGFLGSQAMLVASPMVTLTLDTFNGLQNVLKPGDFKRFTALMERRENIDVLVEKIAKCEDEFLRGEREQKEKAKNNSGEGK